MRASIRGSMRRVIVTDSDNSVPAATADSIKRKSGRFSAQNADSASSLSQRGTSSQLEMVFMSAVSSRVAQGLVHLALIKKLLFRLEPARVDDAHRFAVGPVDCENALAIGSHAQIEIAGLRGEAR